MQLPGRLSATTLGDLLGALHRERVSGLLELRELRGPHGTTVPGRVHRIHLRDGLVAAADTSLPVPRVGELLRRLGLSSEVVERCLVARRDAGDRRAAGEILVASGLASPAAVRAALAEQLRGRLDALFGVEDASLAFYTARPFAHALTVSPLGPSEFLHGRPRARDRLRAGPKIAAPRLEDPQERAFRLLGLSRGAATSEVRRAFRKLACALHPDRLGRASADERRRHAVRFAELSAAYHLLVA